MSPQLLPEAPELPLRSSTRLDTGPGPERPVVGGGARGAEIKRCFHKSCRLISAIRRRGGGRARERHFQSRETGSHENREIFTPPLNIKDNTKQGSGSGGFNG